MRPEALELRVMPISFRGALEHGAREQAFAPERNQTSGIEVPGMKRPEAHRGPLAVKSQDRTRVPDGDQGARCLGAPGASPQAHHGFLQRLLGCASRLRLADELDGQARPQYKQQHRTGEVDRKAVHNLIVSALNGAVHRSQGRKEPTPAKQEPTAAMSCI